LYSCVLLRFREHPWAHALKCPSLRRKHRPGTSPTTFECSLSIHHLCCMVCWWVLIHSGLGEHLHMVLGPLCSTIRCGSLDTPCYVWWPQEGAACFAWSRHVQMLAGLSTHWAFCFKVRSVIMFCCKSWTTWTNIKIWAILNKRCNTQEVQDKILYWFYLISNTLYITICMYSTRQKHNSTRCVSSHCGLAIYIKSYLKAKEE
jgi:hypothetical protein